MNQRLQNPLRSAILNDRSAQLLKSLIEHYILDGQPVSSKTLSEESGLLLSSATVRNVLADLEQQGFLLSPHTSSGRVPTAQAYRLFVDKLITIQPFTPEQVNEFKNNFHRQTHSKGQPQTLLETASSLLSQFTRSASVVTTPKREQVILRHIEFLPLSDHRVLVILVINDQEVQNRVIDTDRLYSTDELQRAANYMNEHYAGSQLQNVRQGVLHAMEADRFAIDRLMQAVIDLADKTFVESAVQDDYILYGQTHLFDMADATGTERLRKLFEAFNQKRDLLNLLDHCLIAQGIQIFIGDESGHGVFDDCSVVTAPYRARGQVVGVVGVVGPKRMAYNRVIPAVDVTAQLLTEAMNEFL